MNIDSLKNEWEELNKEYAELEVSFIANLLVNKHECEAAMSKTKKMPPKISGHTLKYIHTYIHTYIFMSLSP